MGKSPVIVVLDPVPVVLILPGLRTSVHVPAEGNPFRVTLPVSVEHPGWTIVSAAGAAGVTGLAFIITLADGADVQPAAFETT